MEDIEIIEASIPELATTATSSCPADVDCGDDCTCGNDCPGDPR